MRVGKNSQQTSVVMRASDPVYEQGFTFLVNNPETDVLYLTVVDQKTSNEIGQLVYQLSTLSSKENLEITKQPFALLKAGPESKVIFSMHLRVSNGSITNIFQYLF